MGGVRVVGRHGRRRHGGTTGRGAEAADRARGGERDGQRRVVDVDGRRRGDALRRRAQDGRDRVGRGRCSRCLGHGGEAHRVGDRDRRGAEGRRHRARRVHDLRLSRPRPAPATPCRHHRTRSRWGRRRPVSARCCRCPPPSSTTTATVRRRDPHGLRRQRRSGVRVSGGGSEQRRRSGRHRAALRLLEPRPLSLERAGQAGYGRRRRARRQPAADVDRARRVDEPAGRGLRGRREGAEADRRRPTTVPPGRRSESSDPPTTRPASRRRHSRSPTARPTLPTRSTARACGFAPGRRRPRRRRGRRRSRRSCRALAGRGSKASASSSTPPASQP